MTTRLFPNAPRHTFWLSSAMVTAVAGLVAKLPDHPLAVDRAWAQAVGTHRSRRQEQTAMVFNEAGRGVVRGATLAAASLALARRRGLAVAGAFALSEVLAPASVNAAKLVVRRRRPAGSTVDAFGTSFPSGHAAYAAATTVGLVMAGDDIGPTGRRLAWAGAVAGTAGMAWSRTYLRLHWLSDVTAGALLGAGVTLWAFEFVEGAARVGDRLR
ncbi:MAG: phosphatase PAP2 family protein [Gaiellales bacterium]